MPRKAPSKTARQTKAEAYRHDEATRKNIPEAGLVDYEPPAKPKPTEYCWDPRESPQLIWAGKAGMNRVEVDEQASLEVPVVNLHIHERVSTESILRAAKRQDVQRSLFADPELSFSDEIKFYQHDVDWSNRMILGDSLLVMNSLLEREQMRGKVQCIYMDPPYGIKFGSNFQPRIDQRDVKDGKDDDLTREVMQVQAFRDTWELGVHSYLTYLRDRLLLSRELLADTGSIFVQIGDENVHRVRCLMDEVFGEENFVSQISYVTTSGVPGLRLARAGDLVLWYARSARQAKYRQLFASKSAGEEGSGEYKWLMMPDGSTRALTAEEMSGLEPLPVGSRRWRFGPLASSGEPEEGAAPYKWRGTAYRPARGNHWKTNIGALDKAQLLVARKNSLAYYLFADFYPVTPVNNLWTDTKWGFDASDKAYAVQTHTSVIKRCILMTTDPGDLVLDPTCGSGTTAYVAEQWGRRWITCDTSRVALAIARHRLMTGAFDYYRLRHDTSGVAGGFVYKTVPHITLKSIAQNTEIDTIAAEFEPQIAEALKAVNHAFGQEWNDWEVPRGMPESDKDRANLPGGDIQTRMKAINEFWRLKREMQQRIDGSIQRNAPQEELVDQPEVVRSVVRVTGPFTMESIPHPGDVSAETVDTRIVEGEDGLLSEVVELAPSDAPPTEANAAAYVSDMVEKLRRTGVHVKGGRKITFDSLRPLDHEVVHAEGEFALAQGENAAELSDDEKALAGKTVRCAIIFGPQNGAISENHVRDATRAAAPYDAVLFCGYEFTAPAQDVINSDPIPGKRLLMAYVHPDTAMGDLLKDTKASQIFTLVGEPDIVVYRHGDEGLAALLPDAERRRVADVAKRAAKLQPGEMFIELRGVDVYDPLSGETSSDSGANVHAFFIDQDFDGKSFCICQALFPNKADSWAKIARNLKGAIDEDAFEAMRTLVSLPFKPGEQNQVQVKVIDTRGNSVVKTVRV